MATAQIALAASADEDFYLKSSIWYMGGLMTIHADGARTKGQYALIEALAQPGSEPPLHVHDREDELFYILEGSATLTLGDQQRLVMAGESVFLPRRIPHTFQIKTECVRALVLITPAGFEEYFRDLGTPAQSLTLPVDPIYPSMERIVSTAQRYGITMLV